MQRRIGILISAAIVCGMLGWFLGQYPAEAEEETKREPAPMAVLPSEVALVDMGIIFNSHPRLTVFKAALQEEVKLAESEARQQQAEIKRVEEELKKLTAGSREHEALSDELLDKKSKFETFRQKANRRLDQETAAIHMATGTGQVRAGVLGQQRVRLGHQAQAVNQLLGIGLTQEIGEAGHGEMGRGRRFRRQRRA